MKYMVFVKKGEEWKEVAAFKEFDWAEEFCCQTIWALDAKIVDLDTLEVVANFEC